MATETEEKKAWRKAYEQLPSTKAKRKLARENPEVVAKRKAYEQTPEYKAKRDTPEYRAERRAYHRLPETKARRKATRQIPEVKAKRKAYNESYALTEKGSAKAPRYGVYLDSKVQDTPWMLEDSPEDRAKEYIDWHN